MGVVGRIDQVPLHTSPTWILDYVEMDEDGTVRGHVSAPEWNISGTWFGYKYMKVVALVTDYEGHPINGHGGEVIGGVEGSGNNIYTAFNLGGKVNLITPPCDVRFYVNCEAAAYGDCTQSGKSQVPVAGSSNQAGTPGAGWDGQYKNNNFINQNWGDANNFPGHYTGYFIRFSGTVTPPEPDPEPIQCYLRNLNPYDNDQHISASPTSIKVQAYVSSSTPSRNRPNYYWIWETGEEPQVNHDIYQGTWRYAEITYTGLQPGSTHEMHAVAVNDAGAGGQADLTIRTRKEAPTITASIVSTTLETVTFRWSSDRYLARCYAMVGSDTIELGSNVASGTATSKWHEPNTTVSITIHGYVEAGDQETHGSKTISGKTLDIARFTSASGVFGNALRVNFTRASTAYGVMLTMFAKNTSNTTSVTITNGSASSQIRANYADTTFTQAQLDSIYKTYLNNVNTTTMYITISTFGDSTRPGGPKKYNDTQRTYTLTLTGIAKTMWFGVNDDQVPHRCQAWYGDANGTARRGVGFWGDTSGVGRRTI